MCVTPDRWTSRDKGAVARAAPKWPGMADTKAPSIPAVNAYDDGPPPALLEFMVTQWAPKTGMPQPMPELAHFRARRNKLSTLFPGEVLVVATGHEKTRANDTNYRFRPGTDFYYLTGNLEADCVLVMQPRAGGGHDDCLYVEPNPGKSDATFFTDRAKGELWVGARLGVAESSVRYGISTRDLPQLLDDLRVLNREDKPREFRLLRGIDAQLDALLPAQAPRDTAFAEALSEMRLIKDAYEIGEIQKAVDATQAGFEDVIRALPSATNERHVEGVFNMRARVDGNDNGYNTIAASGSHACTLHW